MNAVLEPDTHAVSGPGARAPKRSWRLRYLTSTAPGLFSFRRPRFVHTSAVPPSTFFFEEGFDEPQQQRVISKHLRRFAPMGWQLCRGIGGSFHAESVAAFRWNGWQVCVEYTFGHAYWCLCGCYVNLMNAFGLPREKLTAQADAAATHAREAGFMPPFPWIEVEREIHPDTRPDQRQLAVEACGRIRDPDTKWALFGYRQVTAPPAKPGASEECEPLKAALRNRKRFLCAP